MQIEGIIYRIIDNTTNKTYYGSTTKTLKSRLGRHLSDYKRYCKDSIKYKRLYTSSFLLFDMGEYEIEEVERVLYEPGSRTLRLREQYHIVNNPCININRPAMFVKDDMKSYNKEYYTNNKDKWKKKPKPK
jgi:hypothetical protein